MICAGICASVHVLEAPLQSWPNHPIFRDGLFHEAWDWLDNPGDSAKRRASLRLLATNRHLLPGAVFFNVPPGGFNDERWAPAITYSQQLCRCETRRIMYPTRGRTRLLFDCPQPRRVVVEFDNDYSVSGGYNSPALVIGPRGGGVEEAYAAFMIRKEGLLVVARPFMADQSPDKKQFWTPYDGIAERSSHHWHAPKEVLRDALKLHGEVPFFQAMPDPDGRNGYWGSMPLCTLTAMSTRKCPLRLTFELDMSVHAIPHVRQDFPEHECPPR